MIRDGAAMVRQMQPVRVPGRFVFRTLPMAEVATRLSEIRGMFDEGGDDGLSVLLPAEPGDTDAMAQITLQVYSALDGVGLTAAVSGALATEGIPCNMVAARHHDHLFVPEDRADDALAILTRVSRAGEWKG